MGLVVGLLDVVVLGLVEKFPLNTAFLSQYVDSSARCRVEHAMLGWAVSWYVE